MDKFSFTATLVAIYPKISQDMFKEQSKSKSKENIISLVFNKI